MPQPYIGITDFADASQVQRMVAVIQSLKPLYWHRRLGVGVMMSYKTLNGIPTKWSAAFPPKESIHSIFIDNPHVYNVLHYADYDHHILRREEYEPIRLWGGDNLHAIQLDMIWPNPHQVQGFRWDYPEIEIILQVNTNSLNQIDNNPQKMLTCLKSYGDALTYVLLDKSMGRGLGMDAEALLPFVRAIVEAFPTLGIAIAGGLGPDTLELADPIIGAFGGVSIDAQSRLRPSGNALDPIDWDMAE